jgi:hypothetical protein
MARLRSIFRMRLPPALGTRPRPGPRLDEIPALPNRLNREPRRLERRRPSLARLTQRPVHAPADAILRHARDAPSECRLARERELCPDHQLLAVGMPALPGQVAAGEGVRIAGDLARVLRVRCAAHVVLILAAAHRDRADRGKPGGEPQPALREPHPHETDDPMAGNDHEVCGGESLTVRCGQRQERRRDDMGEASFPASDPPAVWIWDPPRPPADRPTSQRTG